MSSPPPVTFEVVSADEGTELFLIDGNFKLVKRGIGRETFSVPPGVYKLKARAGKMSAERMLIVEPGMPTLRLDPVTIASAMPLRDSAKASESHMAAVHRAAAATAAGGDGTTIFIVARQWTAPDQPAAPVKLPPHPARGLALRRMSGELLADLEKASLETSADPCATMLVAVDPGAYRLTLTYTDGRRIEQSIVACKGWQTQVYLLLDDNARKDEARADLINGAITMRRPGEGFFADDPILRLEEIMRQALEFDRKILSGDMRARIANPRASPMIALLGAHLLIREAKTAKAKKADAAPDDTAALIDSRPEVRTIVENLRAAIGPHPDVEAIAIGAEIPDPKYVFEAPPLLRVSWRLLLKASADRADVLPAESFPSRVADRMWGEGTWLIWLDPDAKETLNRAAPWQATAHEVLSSIVAEERAPVPPVPVARAKPTRKSRARIPFPDAAEEPPLAAAQEVAESAPAVGPVPTTLTEVQRRSLVARLGIPMSRIDAWLAQLNK